MTFEWYGRYSVFSFSFFVQKQWWENKWMRTTFIAVMVIFFFRNVIPKVLSTITTYLDIGIWETPYNWRSQGHVSTYVSILYQDIWFAYFSFSQINLVFKFNLVLIEKFLPQFIYLSTFLWKFTPTKCLFSIFLFSLNQYLLTAKIMTGR